MSDETLPHHCQIEPATKTFGIQTPSGLLLKLRYDIKRLQKSQSSDESRYAAIDCAISSLHLVDWLLQAVPPERHEYLTGKKKSDSVAPSAFIQKQANRFPDLEICRKLANTIKHRELRCGDCDTFSTSHSIIFTPTFDASSTEAWKGKAMPRCFIVRSDNSKEDVYKFFERLERAWREILVENGLLSASLASEEITHE